MLIVFGEDKKKICCFTGHRNIPPEQRMDVAGRPETKLIKLILVLPCKTQTRNWKPEDIRTYEEIKSKSDKVIYTSEEYTKGCMHRRNRRLVDNSDICICYLTSDTGGTAYTVIYAKKNNLPIVNLAENKKIEAALQYQP